MEQKKSSLEIKNVSFAFKNRTVLENFSLSVEPGSFTTLLGPSGCGKTTLLRLIGGFLDVQEGGVFIDGMNQNGVGASLRSVGMVFQDYALFSHMTAYQNIMYGLKFGRHCGFSGDGVRVGVGLRKQQADDVVRSTAKALGIENVLDSFPHELSGGQQQRVALARAVVLKPKILLMDEPLSSLDSNLRLKVREELKQLHKELQITTVYVTHDQEEALFLSDKIAVMNSGRLLQYGTPEKVFFEPADCFTADFIGRANFIKIGGERFLVRPQWIGIKGVQDGRTESLPDGNHLNEVRLCELRGNIISSDFLGGITRLKVRLVDGTVVLADLNTACLPDLGGMKTVELNIVRKWKM